MLKTFHAFPLAILGGIPIAESLAATDYDATQDRIQRLEQQVAKLMNRVAVQDDQIRQQQDALQAQKNNPALQGNIITKTNGRSLSFSTADGEFAMQLGGRLQVDSGFYDGSIDSGDSTDIRRLFLDVRGQFLKDWQYRFQYDFARSGTGDANRGIRDAWIAYDGFEAVSIKGGQFKTPFGLEHLMSSLDSTFMERGLPFLFSPERRIGLQAEHQASRWTAALGAFGGTAEDQPNETQSEDEGWNLIGRVTAVPFETESGLIHTGVAYRQHWVNDEDGSIRFRERPEVHLDGARLIDTGNLSHVEEQQSLGLELAALYGPFSLQSEYVAHRVQRNNASDLDFAAWYGYASLFLTPGDHRTYKNGVFSRVEPLSPVGHGGYGAFEVAVRYSAADLNDGAIQGGELDDLTVGLNWYATSNIRLMANYIKVLDVDRKNHAYDGTDGDIMAFRGQIDF